MKKYYVYSRRIRYVVLADTPIDAIAKMLYKLNPDYKDFGRAIIVSQIGFDIEKHRCGIIGDSPDPNEKDVAFDRDKTLSDLGFFHGTE